MNLVQTRISGGGAGNAVAHVLKVDGNESIQVLAGSADEAFEAEAMAMADGHKFGLRHIIINPDQPLTDEQFEWMIDQINAEYGFDPDDPMLVVKHEKPRQSGDDHHVEAPHFHILRASSSADGKVYDAFNFQKRNELIARRAEIEFGHRQIKGAHNKYVYHQLLERGDQATAEKVHHLTEGSRAHAKYGSKSKSKAERGGVDLPSISAAIADLKGKDSAEMAKGLADIEEQFPGITIDRGDRRKVIVVRAENEVLLNANKALGIKAKAVDDILKAKTEITDDRPTNGRRVESHDGGQLSGTIKFNGTDATGARADVAGDIPEPDARGASNDLEPDLADQRRHDQDSGIGAADRERARGSDAAVARGNPRDDRENGDHTARAHERTRGHQETTAAASSTGRDAGDATLTAVHKINRKRAASELAPALAKAKKAVAGDKEPAQLTARHIIDRRRTAENMKPQLEAAKRGVEGPKAPTVQQKVQRNHAAKGVQAQLAAAKAAVAGDTTPAPAQVTPLQAIKRSRIARNLASALAAAKRAVFGDPKPTFQQKIQRAATASALAPQLEAAKQAIYKTEQIDAKNTEEEATRSQEAARRDADDIELIDDGDDFETYSSAAVSDLGQQIRQGRDQDAQRDPDGPRDGSEPRASRGADERDARDVASGLGSNRRSANAGARPVQRDQTIAGGTVESKQGSSGSNADSGGRTNSQPVASRSALAALGQRYMANKAASGVRASRRSLEQSTKRMKNRHKGDMNKCAAQAMLNERSGGSPQFATLDGDDFQALIAFFQQNQATLRNSI